MNLRMRSRGLFRLILALLLSGLTIPVFSKPVGKAQAALAVSRWLAQDQRPLGVVLNPSIQGVSVYDTQDGIPGWYVVGLYPEGFVIVSADDQIEPIIAFAETGIFDSRDKNPLFALTKRDLTDRQRKARAVQDARKKSALIEKPTPAESKWSRLLTGRSLAVEQPGLTSLSDLRVGPLVQTRWNQLSCPGPFACYNYYTPPNAPGSLQNYPSGCVGTALAQMLFFYRYPTRAVGKQSFSLYVDWVPTTLTLRGGDGKGGAYNWSRMPLSPDATSTLAQRQAVGGLCFDAGVAILTEYTASGSSATIDDVNEKIKSVFGYTNSRLAYVEHGGDLMILGFNDIVNPNLDAGLPVMLSIHSFEAGANHEILCDGYGYQSSTLYHHVNLGWGGTSDAWYALPDIDSYLAKFEMAYACLYNVYPTGTGEILSGRVVDTRGKAVSGAKVIVQRTKGGSWTATTNSHGIYALSKLPSNSQYRISTSGATAKTITLGISVDNQLPAGNRWAVNFTVPAKAKSTASASGYWMYQ